MKKLIALTLLLGSFAAYSAIQSHGVVAAPSSGAVASQPVCSAAVRGLIYNVEGASGAADTFQVCVKDASNNYAWATK